MPRWSLRPELCDRTRPSSLNPPGGWKPCLEPSVNDRKPVADKLSPLRSGFAVDPASVLLVDRVLRADSGSSCLWQIAVNAGFAKCPQRWAYPS